MTKGMAAMLVCTTEECKYSSIVILHHQGGYDVTCKPRILRHLESCHVDSKCLARSRSPRSKNVIGIAQTDRV